MSCWVTPEIAAEWWSISVDDVYRGVESGTISSKHDIGRLFVDVAPHSPQIANVSVESEVDLADWKIVREQTAQRRKRAA